MLVFAESRYELLYDGKLQDEAHLMGLIDVKKLRYDEKKSGSNGNQSGSGRPVVGAKSGGGRPEEKQINAIYKGLNANLSEIIKKSTTDKNNTASHRTEHQEVMQ